VNRRELLGSLAGLQQAVPGRGPRKPNFIVLFADDMGYGDLGCYGHPNIRTPHLDRMAQQGMRFTSGYAAASVCTPSRAGLLTGRYAKRAGLPGNLGPDSAGGLPLSEITLSQHLQGAGYRTMAIGKWHLGHNSRSYLPRQRGFDEYFGLLYSNDMIPPWVKTEKPLQLWRNNEPVEGVEDQSRLTERYGQEAIRFIREAGRNPFFLYLPFAMPHLPVSAPAERRGRSRAGLYGDTIETLDAVIGDILRELNLRGLDRETLVLFASDNGPWHDLPSRMLAKGVEPWDTGSKSLLRGAKGTTWEGGHRVPFLARWTGRIPAGQVSSEMVSTLDYFPTLSAAAGLAMPEGRVHDGHNLLPLLEARTGKSPRTDYLYFLGAKLEAVREGPWKYRQAGEEKGELFHLERDPGEMYDVAGREGDVAARLAGRLAEDRVRI
jgi:arylsulfatase A-like enzyme